MFKIINHNIIATPVHIIATPIHIFTSRMTVLLLGVLKFGRQMREVLVAISRCCYKEVFFKGNHAVSCREVCK